MLPYLLLLKKFPRHLPLGKLMMSACTYNRLIKVKVYGVLMLVINIKIFPLISIDIVIDIDMYRHNSKPEIASAQTNGKPRQFRI